MSESPTPADQKAIAALLPALDFDQPDQAIIGDMILEMANRVGAAVENIKQERRKNMAKPKTNIVIEENKTEQTLLHVWTPSLAASAEIIREIEGVSRVFHITMESRLNVWLNPRYDKAELIAEIRAAFPDE